MGSVIKSLSKERHKTVYPLCRNGFKVSKTHSHSIYLAWFKFAQITGPLQNSEALSLLRKHSYLRVDHFFESERSAFTPFYNKRVYSLDELADQQRTIWFIRNFEKGDSSHEIHSFSSSLNDDKNVDQEFRILPTQDVLWISDLHFSNRHHAFGILPGSDNRLQTRLHKELSELNQKEHTLSHIIITLQKMYWENTIAFSMSSEKREYLR